MEKKKSNTTRAIREGFVIGANPPSEINANSKKKLESASPSQKGLELGARVAALHLPVKFDSQGAEYDRNTVMRNNSSHETFQVVAGSGMVTFGGLTVKEKKEQSMGADLALRLKSLASRVLSKKSTVHANQVTASLMKGEMVRITEEAEELARLLSKTSGSLAKNSHRKR